MQRTRTFVIAFWAALTMLIVVAASGNQYVVRHLVDNAPRSQGQVRRLEYLTLTAFPWRVAPLHGATSLFVAQLVAAGGLVVLTFLLVAAVLSGQRRRRPLAAGLTVWGVVVLLAAVLSVVRALVGYSSLYPSGHDPLGGGRFYFAIYQGPVPQVILFGLLAGLLAALVATVVAAVVNPPRNQVVPGDAAEWRAAGAVADQPVAPSEPWGDHPREEPWRDQPSTQPEWQRPWDAAAPSQGPAFGAAGGFADPAPADPAPADPAPADRAAADPAGPGAGRPDDDATRAFVRPAPVAIDDDVAHTEVLDLPAGDHPTEQYPAAEPSGPAQPDADPSGPAQPDADPSGLAQPVADPSGPEQPAVGEDDEPTSPAPVSAEPPVGDQPAPPAAEPPAAEQPAPEPPLAEQPAAEPPAAESPATEPPAAEDDEPTRTFSALYPDGRPPHRS